MITETDDGFATMVFKGQSYWITKVCLSDYEELNYYL